MPVILPRNLPACGNAGPYQKVHYSARHVKTWRVLSCTRPEGHDGNHQYADGVGSPSHEWSRTGARVFPNTKPGG
jgi:hypothetical protein